MTPLASLDPAPADLATAAVAWGDRWWDPDAGLLWNPDDAFEELPAGRSVHLVPQSAWYAAGLLLRGSEGDLARASSVLTAVLDTQYDAPGEVWDGTFARFQEWPVPSSDATIWVDYDPNWRQFIGTTFSLVLSDLAEGLDDALLARMEAAVRRAVDGEPEGRVPAWYSNIALMKSWLEIEHGTRADRPDVVAAGEALAEEVVRLFDRHGAFDEFNSPTYYGIDLFALRLWRTRSSSARLRSWGARLEDALWEDVARFHHAGLRNLAGPWSRSYGMDMCAYAGALGLWVWGALGRDLAPFPDVARPFGHSHDLFMGGVAALLGADIPAGAAAELEAFSGPRLVRRVISDEPPRVATAWLEATAMLGAESSGDGWSAWGQYHPVTGHWRAPDGSLAWFRLRHRAPVLAEAGERSLTATCHPHPRHGPQPVVIEVLGPGLDLDGLRAGRWSVPGLLAEVVADAPVADVTVGADGVVAVRYEPVDGPARWRIQLLGT